MTFRRSITDYDFDSDFTGAIGHALADKIVTERISRGEAPFGVEVEEESIEIEESKRSRSFRVSRIREKYFAEQNKFPD